MLSRPWFLTALSLLAAAGCSEALQRPAPDREPYHRFRSRSLEYPGPGREDPEPTGLSEVAIGWFGPSDAGDELGGPMWLAAGMAVREANEAGGYKGLPFRLVPVWSENPWGSGVSLVVRMAYETKVWAVVGSIDGPSTHLAEQDDAKVRLPLVSPVATDKSVNLAGVPWMFSCAPGDHLYADLLAGSILARPGSGDAGGDDGDGFVLLRSTAHDARLAAREILRACARRNRGPDRVLDFHPSAHDFASLLEILRERPPPAVLIAAGARDSARLVAAIREQGLRCRLYGTPAMGRAAFLGLAGTAAEGIRFPLLLMERPGDPAARDFRRRFSALAGTAPDYTAAHTYDAVRLLVAAIRRAGLNRARIRDTLVELSPWRGVTGEIRWDATGQNTRPVTAMAVVRDGRIVPEKPLPGEEE
jgi:ABC-type branched-subunit amino acid transport system substrate-binding protein